MKKIAVAYHVSDTGGSRSFSSDRLCWFQLSKTKGWQQPSLVNCTRVQDEDRGVASVEKPLSLLPLNNQNYISADISFVRQL